MLRNSSLTANVDAAEVIRAAAGSTCGVLSLGCLIVAVLAFLFFGKDHVRVRLAMFAMIFAAGVGMGMAVFAKADKVTGRPRRRSHPRRDRGLAARAGAGRRRTYLGARRRTRRSADGLADAEAGARSGLDRRGSSGLRATSGRTQPPVSAGPSIGGITDLEAAAALSSLINDLPYEAVISSDEAIESLGLTFGSRDGGALTLKAAYGLGDQHFPSSTATTAMLRGRRTRGVSVDFGQPSFVLDGSFQALHAITRGAAAALCSINQHELAAKVGKRQSDSERPLPGHAFAPECRCCGARCSAA